MRVSFNTGNATFTFNEGLNTVGEKKNILYKELNCLTLLVLSNRLCFPSLSPLSFPHTFNWDFNTHLASKCHLLLQSCNCKDSHGCADILAD